MSGPVEAPPERQGRSALVTATFAGLLSVAFVGFLALGIWQVQRMVVSLWVSPGAAREQSYSTL